MKSALYKSLSIATLAALPAAVFAQTPSNLTSLIAWAGDILNRVIPVLIAFALVVFFWGLVQYIRTHKGGKDIMIAGLVGLFIMTSVWGIIRLAQNTFGVNNSAPVSVPQVPQR